MRTYLFIILSLLMVSQVSADQTVPNPAGAKTAIRAAIFVQNRAGNDFQAKLDTFKDLITARLTEKGFALIDKNDVLAKFQESPNEDNATKEAIKTAVDLTKANKTEASVEDIITDASALRIAQMLGVDYLIFATITSYGEEQKVFKGQGTVYGTDNAVTDHIMRITLKVCDGAHGSTIYGDVVNASERIPQSQNLQINSTDTVNKLFDSGAGLVADNVSAKIEDIRAANVPKGAPVAFDVNSSIPGATVELDGAAIGSTPGHFKALEGLHQLRISKERYATWEKTVNIFAGQKLDISMELSQEGIQRLGNATSVDNNQQIAQGQAKALNNSYVHDDGIGHEIKHIVQGGGN